MTETEVTKAKRDRATSAARPAAATRTKKSGKTGITVVIQAELATS